MLNAAKVSETQSPRCCDWDERLLLVKEVCKKPTWLRRVGLTLPKQASITSLITLSLIGADLTIVICSASFEFGGYPEHSRAKDTK